MSDHKTMPALTTEQLETAAKALRWAAFGGHRGPGFIYQQREPNRLHFETVYQGRKAWVDLDIPYTPVSLIVAGALLLQQLNPYMG